MIKSIAELIWESGTTKLHCVIPGEELSDFIITNYSATHFILNWLDRGKKVRICFFRADKYGPSKNIGEIIKEEIVDV